MTTERVTYRPEGQRARTIYLEDVQNMTFCAEPAITGIQVDREGDEVSGRGYDQVQHIIQTSLIVRRVVVVMNKIYGQLEEVACL